mmetsp:Transcript_8541/g.25674  ORF Transcript_8541/g.25674 Transcript_8541/m.25674 type:complete len:560 (-) Transcript_8541:480-2159(-)
MTPYKHKAREILFSRLKAAQQELCRVGTSISYIALSPLGTYLLTWCRASLSPNSNLRIWNSSSGEQLAQFSQKDYSPKKWPTVQWTDDESLACRAVTNEVHFYDADNVGGHIKFKARIPKIEFFSLSRGRAPHRLATFSPVTKSDPAKVSIVDLPDGKVLSNKSIFRANEAQFRWNNTGSAVLAVVTSDVDATSRSYYGESSLFFLDVLGQNNQRLDMPKEGPICDAQWAPRGTPYFIVVYGVQPAQATMFNSKCEPVFSFGSGAWNCVYFSPHGRFVALCGFQSLSGDVEIWDRVNECKVGSTKMTHTTVFSWSPCSRYIIAATTFPRLRVDNGYRIYKYDGTLLKKVEYNTFLLQAEFLPAPINTYPDRPASPKSAEQKKAEASSGGKTIDLSKVTEKKVYRPPAFRDGTVSVSYKPESVDVKPGKISAASWSSGRASVVGGESEAPTALTKSQLKNRKKKKAQAARKQGDSDAADDGQEQEELQQQEQIVDEAESEQAVEKKLRAIKKKMRRASDKSKEDRSGMSTEEKVLIDSLPELQKEITALEKKLFALQTGS